MSNGHSFSMILPRIFSASAAALLASTPALAQHYGEPSKLKDFVSRDEVLVNAVAIDRSGFRSSQLAELPWSDTYWPDVQGSIASPYNVSNASHIPLFWGLNNGFFSSRDASIWSQPVSSLDAATVDDMSPAEKYDLLLGDSGFTLSRQVIAMVRELYKDNQTATWSGVCHGWSPASLNLARPLKAFTVNSAAGIPITFYPADVRALSSFLWGKSYAQDYVKIEGWQCKKGVPSTDNNGRLKDPECFDVNPGFFHLLLVNQIGLNRQGMIMDRASSSKIMNQPVYGYSFSYYNPNTRMEASSFESALVRKEDFGNDPFPGWRSPRTRAVVGVETKVFFRNEKNPTHDRVNRPEDDEKETLVIQYDLELDENLDIVGGEWRDYDKGRYGNDGGFPNFGGIVNESSNRPRPDFVWLTPPGLKAWSVGDFDLAGSEWDGTTPAPQAWRDAAAKAARNINRQGKHQPQPLARVVDLLIDMSRK